MLPPLASPDSASTRPSPTIAAVMPMRSAFVTAETARARSMARCTSPAARRCPASQRRVRVGSIPSASTTSAAPTASAARRNAVAAASFAASICRRDTLSPSRFITRSTMQDNAPSTANPHCSPISASSMTGVHMASNGAVQAGLATKLRRVSRSFSASDAAPAPRPPAATARTSGKARRRVTFPASASSAKARSASSSVKTSRHRTRPTTSTPRVSTSRVASTRLNTCMLNSGTASAPMLHTRLSAAMPSTPRMAMRRVSAVAACPSGSAWRLATGSGRHDVDQRP